MDVVDLIIFILILIAHLQPERLEFWRREMVGGLRRLYVSIIGITVLSVSNLFPCWLALFYPFNITSSLIKQVSLSLHSSGPVISGLLLIQTGVSSL